MISEQCMSINVYRFHVPGHLCYLVQICYISIWPEWFLEQIFILQCSRVPPFECSYYAKLLTPSLSLFLLFSSHFVVNLKLCWWWLQINHSLHFMYYHIRKDAVSCRKFSWKKSAKLLQNFLLQRLIKLVYFVGWYIIKNRTSSGQKT